MKLRLCTISVIFDERSGVSLTLVEQMTSLTKACSRIAYLPFQPFDHNESLTTSTRSRWTIIRLWPHPAHAMSSEFRYTLRHVNNKSSNRRTWTAKESSLRQLSFD